MSIQPIPQPCEHKWVHLRRSDNYEIRWHVWGWDDIFFCEKCLQERVIQKETPERTRYGF